jgi:Fe-S-cluster formation regulator IscX/YfhJ
MTNALENALLLIDKANADDPLNGVELLYSQRMLETLQSFKADASEPLTLACYAQHVCRWKLVRTDYLAGLEGYLKWRTDLAKLHASILKDAMSQSGYSNGDIKRATNIIQKRKLKVDPETQTLEDISCLVFLTHYFDSFASKHSDEKIIDIVQKTWGKMSEQGHQSALALVLPSHLQTLVGKALA